MNQSAQKFSMALLATLVSVSLNAHAQNAMNVPMGSTHSSPTILAGAPNSQKNSSAVTTGQEALQGAELLAINSVHIGAEQKIIFSFSKKKPAIKSFSLKNPQRFVIDFMQTDNRTNHGALEFQGSGLKNMEFSSDKKRLRSILALHPETEVTESWLDNDYVITIKNTKLAQKENEQLAKQLLGAQTPTANTPTTMSALPEEVLRVDYRKGKSTGAGRLVLDLSSSSTPIDIKAAKNGVIIDVMNAAVPAHLQKKIDVAEFMTPASSMELRQMPDRTRVILRTQGKWEQNAYQVENKFVFELNPVFNETVSQKVPGEKEYKGNKLTLNFQNIEVRTVLQVLAEFSGLNIITSDSVGGNITLLLKEVPWDQALDLILTSRNLDSRKNGNVVWVAPQAEIRAKEKADADFRREQEENRLMETESFQINYASAAQITALLTNAQQRMLSKNGSAVFDDRTNNIFVQDTPDKIASIRALIKKIDIPISQVMIEAKIVEATESFGKSLGARLGYNDLTGSKAFGGNRVAFGAQGENTMNSLVSGKSDSFTGSQFVNLPSSGVNGKAPGLFSFILFNNAATKFLNLELSALVAEGKGQILSNPRVVTLNKQNAVIKQGTRIPFSTRGTNGETSTTFAEANLELNANPQITPDGNVFMELKISKNSVGAVTANGPAIDTKEVSTKVLVENEGMVIIGGIFEQSDRRDEERVPFFGDLPYIGNLFKTRANSSERRELLVFVSPKIVHQKQKDLAEIDEEPMVQETINPIFIKPSQLNPQMPFPALDFSTK